ncbi:MAG: hypothetical protein LUQ71_09180 [Methanoregula sp.]|nr:hypothetical protein [Methanoregula sp.]
MNETLVDRALFLKIIIAIFHAIFQNLLPNMMRQDGKPANRKGNNSSGSPGFCTL